MRLKKISIFLFFILFILGIIIFMATFFGSNKESLEQSSVPNLALGHPITASSSSDKAQILVDGQELPNASWHTSWSPPQNPSRPSWVTIDLGKRQNVQRLVIAFSIAAYDGIYDIWAPPNSIVVELGDSPNKTQPVKVIPSEEIPENGACPDGRRLEIHLKEPHDARYVKLIFPTGGKLAAMPDVVGLGEIAVYGPEPEIQNHKKASLEGKFGRIVVDLESPQIISFFLREPDGALAQKDLLSGPIRGVTLLEAKSGKIFSRQGAYTYVSDQLQPAKAGGLK